MNEGDRLRQELCAAREELAREQSQDSAGPDESGSRLPLMPDRDEQFLRLSLLSVDGLEMHVERLERDIEDLQRGIDRSMK